MNVSKIKKINIKLLHMRKKCFER